MTANDTSPAYVPGAFQLTLAAARTEPDLLKHLVRVRE